MSHRHARLAVHGRRILVERVQSGRPVAHVAAETGMSRPTAHTWVHRWRHDGEAGLLDLPSRPRTVPHRTAATVEARVCRLRTGRKLSPASAASRGSVRSWACRPRPCTGSWSGTV